MLQPGGNELDNPDYISNEWQSYHIRQKLGVFSCKYLVLIYQDLTTKNAGTCNR